MEEIALKFFSVYGPLGLGWVAALFLWKEYKAVNAKYIELVQQNIEANLAMTQVIEAMKTVIQSK